MSGDIEEQVGVLRRRIFGSVGSGVAHDHEDRLIGISMLGLAEEGEGAVRDQVGEVILCVVKSVLHLKSNQNKSKVISGGNQKISSLLRCNRWWQKSICISNSYTFSFLATRLEDNSQVSNFRCELNSTGRRRKE